MPFQSMECIVVARPYLVNVQKALGRSYYYTACDAFWWNNTAFLWSTSHGWWFHCYGVVDLWRQLSPLTHWVTKLRQSVCEHNWAKILLNSYLHWQFHDNSYRNLFCFWKKTLCKNHRLLPIWFEPSMEFVFMFHGCLIKLTYRIVAITSPSRIEAHAGLFDPYVPWPFDKKLIF